MKRTALLVLIIIAFAGVVNAQGKFGLGLIVGEPTGISGKMKISSENAFDGAVGWSFNKYGAIHVHADYLYNMVKLGQDLPLYVGVGGRIKLSSGTDESRLGARVPIGIVYEPSSKPFDLFIETVPMLDIVPTTEFNWNAAAGVRYYFK